MDVMVDNDLISLHNNKKTDRWCSKWKTRSILLKLLKNPPLSYYQNTSFYNSH